MPLGEHVVGDTWELWIIESVRGEEALRRIKEANQFNDDPEPGMEFVLVESALAMSSPTAVVTTSTSFPSR